MFSRLSVALLLVMVFMFFFPLSEFVFLDYGDISLLFFLISQFIALFVSCFVFYFVFYVRATKKIVFLDLGFEVFFQWLVFWVTFFGFLIFLVFYFRYVSSLNTSIIFAEGYRNGVYKGSGLFTIIITQFCPIAIAFLVARFKKLLPCFYISFLMVFFASLMLGLWVFLLIVYIFLIIRILSGDGFLKKAFILFFLVIFFVFYKIILSDDLVGRSILDIVLHITGRVSYRDYIYNSGFSLGFFDAFGYMSIPIDDSYCDLSCYKEGFVKVIPDIFLNKPNIELFSGVALPYPLIIFNVFGFLGFVFVVPVLLFFMCSIYRVFTTKDPFSSMFFLVCSYFCFSILSEDILYFKKIPFYFVLFVLFYLFIRFSLFFYGKKIYWSR